MIKTTDKNLTEDYQDRFEEIDCETLKRWLEEDEVLLLDVREPEEYTAVRIEKAISFPLSQFQVNNLPEDHGKKIVFQCHMGRRSATACSLSISQGYKGKIYNLAGGIMAWLKANYPTLRF